MTQEERSLAVAQAYEDMYNNDIERFLSLRSIRLTAK